MHETFMAFHLTCWHCDWESLEAGPITACPTCGGMIEFSTANVLDRPRPDACLSVSDFDRLMPIDEPTAQYPEYNHPFTPLVRADVLSDRLGISLTIKDETVLPTATWKDREAFVIFQWLRRHGLRDVVLASAGNTGTALARAAGILGWCRLHLLLPESSRDRVATLPHFTHDAVKLIYFSGPNDEGAAQARAYAHAHGFALEGGFTNYLRREGLKTLGLELIQQADAAGISFDWYVQAVAGGIGVYSFWKAHVDSARATSQPRILGVQADVCQPFVNAWRDRSPSLEPRHVPTGVTPSPFVRVLRTRNPVDSYRCLFDIQSRTDGDFVGVSDAEILAGLRLFYEEPYFREAYARRGMIVGLEPATALAGLVKQVRCGAIPQGSSVVLNCSGAAKTGDVDPAWLEG